MPVVTADSSAGGTMQTAHIAAVAMFGLAKGVPMAEITEATGLKMPDLLRFDGRVDGMCMPNLWLLIERYHPNVAISLQMANSAPMSFLGTLGLLVGQVPSLPGAAKLIVEHARVLADALEVSVSEVNGELSLTIWHPLDVVDHGLAADCGLAMGVRMIRDVLNAADALLRVEFTHKPNGPVADYERFFRVPVSFEQPSNRVVLDANLVEGRQLVGAGKWQNSVVGQLHAALPLFHPPASKLVARVQTAVTAVADRHNYTVAAVCDELAMSRRALQRRLAKEGTSIKLMLDKTRQQRALMLLSDPEQNMASIATALDYADERAFRRAFQRWTGCTPSEYRRSKVDAASGAKRPEFGVK